MTAYRPSARIRLTIRTEEFEDTSDLEARLPDPERGIPNAPTPSSRAQSATSGAASDTSAERLRVNQERRAALNRQRATLPPEEFERQERQLDDEWEDIYRGNVESEDDAVQQPPESVAGAARDDLTVVGMIEPVSCEIQRNGLATADTMSVVIDYADAPIDPRIIRAVGIEAIVGVVPPDDYEAGMERLETRGDGSLLSLIGANDEGVLEGATRFVGFVDEWSVQYSDTGDTVTLECRDMSAPLRDTPLISGESIDLSLPIDEGITALLNSSATTRGMTVIYGGDGDAPTPSESAPVRRRARRGRRSRRARRAQQMSLWDHINDVVRGLGLVPITRGYDIVLIEPRTLYTTAGVARMVFGRNLVHLDFNRRLTGVKVPTIEVRSYDSDRGRTLWARYPTRSGDTSSGVMGEQNPPGPRRANDVTPSGSNPNEKIQTILVSGVTDPSLLEATAQSAYEQIGRQEIEGSLSTFDAWSYDQPPGGADLLDLTAGDPVELLVVSAHGEEEEAAGASTTLARIQAMDRNRRTDYMVALGWNETIAARFAALQDATGFQTTFRVQDVRISWDSESGLKVSLDFINYIVVREES
jgi:hypothetical protein